MKTNELLADINCTGCFACYNSCPFNAITISKDINGYLTPNINNEKCVNCRKCLKVCPERNRVALNKSLHSYVGFCNDESIYNLSSSGGVFAAIAHAFIKSGGVVFGAAYINSNCEVKHIVVDNLKSIARLQGSKYVQSNVENSYQKTADFLKSGKKVLFSGTPCQIAGFYSYLNGLSLENIFTVEIICHGVSNDMMLKKSLASYHNGRFPNELRFRNKTKYEKSSFSLKLIYSNNKTKVIDAHKDLYYRMYVDGLIYRKSCYKCYYATNDRKADITLGDCSTYKDYRTLSKIKALSTIIVNSSKGEYLLDTAKINLTYCQQDMRKEMASNSQLNHPTPQPTQLDSIYDDFRKLSIRDLKKKYVRYEFKYEIKRFIKSIIPLRIRALLSKNK